jgi:hypothetical protein
MCKLPGGGYAHWYLNSLIRAEFIWSQKFALAVLLGLLLEFYEYSNGSAWRQYFDNGGQDSATIRERDMCVQFGLFNNLSHYVH